jgi:hypothetical protein
LSGRGEGRSGAGRVEMVESMIDVEEGKVDMVQGRIEVEKGKVVVVEGRVEVEEGKVGVAGGEQGRHGGGQVEWRRNWEKEKADKREVK